MKQLSGWGTNQFFRPYRGQGLRFLKSAFIVTRNMSTNNVPYSPLSEDSVRVSDPAPSADDLDDGLLRVVWCILWYTSESPPPTQVSFCQRYAINKVSFNAWLHGRRGSKLSRTAAVEYLQSQAPRLRSFSRDLFDVVITNKVVERKVPDVEVVCTEFSKLGIKCPNFLCLLDFPPQLMTLLSSLDLVVPWKAWRFLWRRYHSFEGVALDDSEALTAGAMAAMKKCRKDQARVCVWSVFMHYAAKISISAILLLQYRPEVCAQYGKLVTKPEYHPHP
jgi:hypothetical protein